MLKYFPISTTVIYCHQLATIEFFDIQFQRNEFALPTIKHYWLDLEVNYLLKISLNTQNYPYVNSKSWTILWMLFVIPMHKYVSRIENHVMSATRLPALSRTPVSIAEAKAYPTKGQCFPPHTQQSCIHILIRIQFVDGSK